MYMYCIFRGEDLQVNVLYENSPAIRLQYFYNYDKKNNEEKDP